MNTVKTKLAILIQLVLCINMHAEIPFTQIKGLYTVLNKDKHYLSPVHGFNWWKLDMIQNMYRFGDQEHATIQLIRELFFLQHDGVTFDITTLKYNPASYFTPITIGKILNAIEQSPDEKSLKEALTSIMNNVAQKMEPYKNNVADALKKTEQEFNTHSAALKKQTDIHASLTKQLEKTDEIELVMAHKNLASTIERLTTLKDAARKDRESKRNILKQLEAKPNKLVDLISASLKESDDTLYAKNTLHSILLACAYKRSNEKQDFLDFFNQFTQPIVTIKDINEWLTAQYTQNDFTLIKQAIASKDYSFLDDYERASFFGYALKVWDNPLPPIISSIGNAIYAPDGIAYDFPDCGETSIRNFFNIILYDAQKKSFDVSLLPNGTSASVVSYYKNHPSADAVNTKKYYDDWTSVVSNLPGVKYSKTTANNQGYDITPGLDNLMKVFDHVLFEGNQEFATSTVDKKLDFICKVASRQDFSCEWDVLNGTKEDVLNKRKNNSITLQFTITRPKNNSILTWEFLPNHFILQRSQSYTDISSLLNKPLVDKITNNSPSLITLLGWYSSPSHFDNTMTQLLEKNVADTLQYLYFIQQLSDNEQRKKALLSTLKGKKIAISDKALISMISSFPANNYYLKDIITTIKGYKNDNANSDTILNTVLTQSLPSNKIKLLTLLLERDIFVSKENIIQSINSYPRPLNFFDWNTIFVTLYSKNKNPFDFLIPIVEEIILSQGVMAPLKAIVLIVADNINEDTEKLENNFAAIKSLHSALTKQIKKLSSSRDQKIKKIVNETTELANQLKKTIELFEKNPQFLLPENALLYNALLSLPIISNKFTPEEITSFMLQNTLSALSSLIDSSEWKKISQSDQNILFKAIDECIQLTPSEKLTNPAFISLKKIRESKKN